MKTIRLPLAVLLVAGTTAAAAQISRTELARAPLDGIQRGAGAIVRVELPPGGSTDRHRHPGQEYVYVVSGSLVIEPAGSAPVRLGPS